MRLSVPPNVTPRRVSVDAIEHFLIYREPPLVGAILHVHAWMEGIASTHINFPCGTYDSPRRWRILSWRAPDRGARRDRVEKSRSDDHRREFGRDLRPRGEQDPAAGADELSRENDADNAPPSSPGAKAAGLNLQSPLQGLIRYRRQFAAGLAGFLGIQPGGFSPGRRLTVQILDPR